MFPEEEKAYEKISMLSWLLPLTAIIGSLMDTILVVIFMKLAHPWKDILFGQMEQTEETQIEIDDAEHHDPVHMGYIGNKNITMALKNLKAELTRVRSDATQIVSGGKDIEETVVANHAESPGDKDNEIIILEHEDKETMMDC